MNTIVEIIINLFVVTLLHEAGHALAAKLYGLKVTAFAIFFLPVISFTIGGTKFSIGIIPMGGYTLIPGLYKLERGDRLIIYSAGIFLNVLTFLVTLFFLDSFHIPGLGIISMVVAVINLLPIEPFDGKKIFSKIS